MIWGIRMLQLLDWRKKLTAHPADTLVGLRSHKAIKAQQRVSNSAAAEATVEDRRPSCPGAAHQHWTTAASNNLKGPVDPRNSRIPRTGRSRGCCGPCDCIFQYLLQYSAPRSPLGTLLSSFFLPGLIRLPSTLKCE